MYGIVKSVLKSGSFNLSDILKKIDSLWVQGKLSDDEYNELVETARNSAKTEYSVDILSKIEEMDKRLNVLENEKTVTDTTETVTDFVEGKWYYNGDKCVYYGKTYTCIAPDGVVCVWSPEVYPAYWESVES